MTEEKLVERVTALFADSDAAQRKMIRLYAEMQKPMMPLRQAQSLIPAQKYCICCKAACGRKFWCWIRF